MDTEKHLITIRWKSHHKFAYWTLTYALGRLGLLFHIVHHFEEGVELLDHGTHPAAPMALTYPGGGGGAIGGGNGSGKQGLFFHPHPTIWAIFMEGQKAC